MTRMGEHNAVASHQLPARVPPRVPAAGVASESGEPSPSPSLIGRGGKSDEELKEAFTQFVGETFFAQLIKSMRSTVGKPAYFYGGRGEEVFQGRLDQQLAEHMTEASAAKFTEPLFERQFPHLKQQTGQNDLHELTQLRRL